MNVPVPNLITAYSGPLHHVEKVILNQIAAIEAWFRKEWLKTPPPITSSVDLRHGGFKLAPVDTNLFPAGFNNLNPDFLPLCVQAAQSFISKQYPSCSKLLILPESHTRNRFYLQSLSRLRDVFMQAGFVVRIGSLDPDIKSPQEILTDDGDTLLLEPLVRTVDAIGLADFKPCLIVLNNDLSAGVPEILKNVQQSIQPAVAVSWATRLKSHHFNHYLQVAEDFSRLTGLDSWFINPFFRAVDGVDFMTHDGMEQLAVQTDAVLEDIRQKYESHGVSEAPFVVVKSDNGTYGMSVMMVQSGDELLQLNRKQRTRMAVSKGQRKVNRVIIQEGVYSFETMQNGAVAEPVVYMIGEYVVGGFYRVHQGRGKAENLNAPGMHFEPLAFAKPCNMPREDLTPERSLNRFYAYGVIARLAALAAAREIAEITQ